MTGRYDAQLRPKVLVFYLLTLLLVLALSVSVVFHHSIKALETTAAHLKRSTSGLGRMQAAITNRRTALTLLTSQLQQEHRGISPERLIYGKADEIKSRFRNGVLTIGPIELTSPEASLPYTITLVNAHYATFLSDIGYLQNSVFPFTPISEVTIAQADAMGAGAGAGSVTFTIKGAIRTPLRDKP